VTDGGDARSEDEDARIVREFTTAVVLLGSVILAVAAFYVWVDIRSGPDLSGCTFDLRRNGVHGGLAGAVSVVGSVVPFLAMRRRLHRTWVIVAFCIVVMCVVSALDFGAWLTIAGSHQCFD
jgi:hypothetical protein